MNAEATRLTARLRAAGCVRAEDEASLLLGERWTPAELERRVLRRVRGEPLEWVLGWAQFADLRLAIDPGVFVPRQRTVALAEEAAALLAASAPPRIVLEACTGCGPVACLVARDCPDALAIAGDIDLTAVDCARRNGQPYGVSVVRSDLLAGFPPRLRGRVSVVVANVPYVPDDALAAMPAEAREWEPRGALAGGDDGLHILRGLAAQAVGWLRPGGSLLTEISRRQAAQAALDLSALGYAVEVRRGPADDSAAVLAAAVG